MRVVSCEGASDGLGPAELPVNHRRKGLTRSRFSRTGHGGVERAEPPANGRSLAAWPSRRASDVASTMTVMSVRDLIIVGAGPAGLVGRYRRLRSRSSTTRCSNRASWSIRSSLPPQMVFFTTPELLEIGGLPFCRRTKSRRARSAPLLPPGRRQLRPADRLRREGAVGASVTTAAEDDALLRRREASRRTVCGAGATRATVVFAIGYYDHPNCSTCQARICRTSHHYYGEPHAYYRQRVVIVGGEELGRRSGAGAVPRRRDGDARAPRAELKSTIKYWVRPDIENRIKEGSIAAHFQSRIVEIRPTTVMTSNWPGRTVREVPADAVFLLTGYHADIELMRGPGSISGTAAGRSTTPRPSKPTCGALRRRRRARRRSTPAASSSRTGASMARRS